MGDYLLSKNATQLLEQRYLLRDGARNIVESPCQLFKRVAKSVGDTEELKEKFYHILSNLEFLPNSPVLMNAGTSMGQLSACFVLPIEDSMESIFSALKTMAIVHQTGGGTGFNFSHIRPKGDIVNSTKGNASGPLSFMRIFDTATDTIVQGGRRRGANMGILNCDHPDILDFIQTKKDKNNLNNFNLSVAVTNSFMRAIKNRKDYALINPRTNSMIKKVSANKILDAISLSAWETGDPGVIFMDTINKHNPLPSLGRIESTNPCGEVPLLPYESCTLGSINLAKITITKQIDWSKLKGLVWLGVRFLDNVIEVNKYILPEIEKTAKENRKIGLGVMGFADMLIQLGIPYNSEKAASTAKEIMKFISSESHKASGHLAKERGNFPNYIRSIYYNKYPMRNATCTTIAPTGTLSIIAGCSSGIEPIFAINYERNISGGSTIREINPYFEEYARKCNFYSKNLFDEIRHTGSAQNIKQIPETVRELFRTAAEIHPFQHLSIQSAFQKFTDNAVSKTINLPTNSSPRDIKNIFLKAFDLGCKGVTVYRYSSIKGQILRLEGFEDQCVPHKCYF